MRRFSKLLRWRRLRQEQARRGRQDQAPAKGPHQGRLQAQSRGVAAGAEAGAEAGAGRQTSPLPPAPPEGAHPCLKRGACSWAETHWERDSLTYDLCRSVGAPANGGKKRQTRSTSIEGTELSDLSEGSPTRESTDDRDGDKATRNMRGAKRRTGTSKP